MQDYAMRERIYLPVVRFGVPHTDWKYVLAVTMIGFVVPFLMGFRIFGVPAPMFTGVLSLAASVGFFNFIRLGRKPLWFQHSLRALVTNPVSRARLPTDELNESWIKEEEGADDVQLSSARMLVRSASASAFRFEHL